MFQIFYLDKPLDENNLLHDILFNIDSINNVLIQIFNLFAFYVLINIAFFIGELEQKYGSRIYSSLDKI